MFNAVDNTLQAKDQQKQASVVEIKSLRAKLGDVICERTAYNLMIEVL